MLFLVFVFVKQVAHKADCALSGTVIDVYRVVELVLVM